MWENAELLTTRTVINYIRAAKVWNTLPVDIRDTTKSVPSFKTLLRKHYINLTSSIFNPDDPSPRTLKWQSP